MNVRIRLSKLSKVNLLLAGLVLIMGFAPIAARAAGSVSFWSQSATDPWVVEAIEQFTEETGIEVDVRAIGWGLEELIVAYAAGASPDVWTHGGAALGALAAQGLPQSLDDWVERWEHADDVAPQALETVRYEGRIVGLPWRGIAVGAMPFRADLFLEAGFSPDEPPETWNDLVEYGRKLVRRDENGKLIRNGFNVSDSGWNPSFWFRLFTLQTGIDVFRDESHRLTDPRIERAVAFYADLFHRHRLSEPGFAGSVSTGTAVMGAHPLGSGVMRLIDEFVETGGDANDMRFAVYPHPGEPKAVLTGDFIAVTSGTSNRADALALVGFLMDPERHERFTMEWGNIPIFRQAVDWDWVVERPQVNTMMQIMFDYGSATAPHPRFFEIRQVQNDVMKAALTGAQAARTVLQQYEAVYQEAWHGE